MIERKHEPDLPRNLGLELVRATEAAAYTAGLWRGMGDAYVADHAAANKMLDVLNTIAIDGVLVIGEEIKANYDGPLTTNTEVGMKGLPAVDLVVDPIDGLDLLAKGYPGSIAAAALAPRGSFWVPSGANYMNKIVVDSDVAPYLVHECMDSPAAWTLALVARAKGVKVNKLRVFMLDRPRHEELISEIRMAGAHVILYPDGDIAGALMVCTPHSGVDLMMGTGGIAEGLMAASAVRAMGGAMLGRLDPQSRREKDAVLNAGYDINNILTAEDMIDSEQIFFAATGITDSSLLRRVTYARNKAETESITLRNETRTRRRIIAEHLLDNNA